MKELGVGVYRVSLGGKIGECAKLNISAFLQDRIQNCYFVIRVLDEVGWEWANEYGNWPKRLSKKLKKNGFVLSNDDLSKLGKLAKEDCLADRDLTIHIRRPHYDLVGLYGDCGVCYRKGGEHQVAVGILRANDGYHIGFHDENDQPIGRCWGINQYPNVVLFNGYAVAYETLGLLQMSRMVAELLGRPWYQKVTLKNDDRADGGLYINGPNGYLLGDTSLSQESFYDLGGIGVVCNYCGETITHNEVKKINIDTWACEECDENTIECNECGIRVNYEYSRSFGEDDEVCYCEKCYRHLAVMCEDCGEEFHRDDIEEVGDKVFCTSCSFHWIECDDCGDAVHEDDIKEVKGKELCGHCAKEYDQCLSCKAWDQKDNMIRTYLGYVCNGCKSELKECEVCGREEYGPMMSQFDGIMVCTSCYGHLRYERKRLLTKQFVIDRDEPGTEEARVA